MQRYFATHNHFQQPKISVLGNDLAALFQNSKNFVWKTDYKEVNISTWDVPSNGHRKEMGAGLRFTPIINKLMKMFFPNKAARFRLNAGWGMENTNGFDEIIAILNQYPFEEVILHPRIGKQQYKGRGRYESFCSICNL